MDGGEVENRRMSHAEKELSSCEYIRYILRISLDKTRELITPHIARLKEHLIRWCFVLFAAALTASFLKRTFANLEVFSLQTLLQAPVVAAVMLLFILALLALGFLTYLVRAPYQVYKEVRKEAEQWLTRHSAQVEANKKLEIRIRQLDSGTTDEDVAELLLEEMERNKRLKGMHVGSPEHKYLDAMIESLERQKVKHPITDALYQLRRRTQDQERLADISSSRNSQYNSHYLPNLKATEEVLRSYISTCKKSEQQEDDKNETNH